MTGEQRELWKVTQQRERERGWGEAAGVGGAGGTLAFSLCGPHSPERGGSGSRAGTGMLRAEPERGARTEGGRDPERPGETRDEGRSRRPEVGL